MTNPNHWCKKIQVTLGSLLSLSVIHHDLHIFCMFYFCFTWNILDVNNASYCKKMFPPVTYIPMTFIKKHCLPCRNSDKGNWVLHDHSILETFKDLLKLDMLPFLKAKNVTINWFLIQKFTITAQNHNTIWSKNCQL